MASPAGSSSAKQLKTFLKKYSPEIAGLAQLVLRKMRQRLPGATQLVYDNYNALVIGFGPSERASEAIFSIALYPRWINLFFLRGAELDDPAGILCGSGKIVRSIKLMDVKDLDQPAVVAMIDQALRRAPRPIDSLANGELIIRAISENQRSRLPRKAARR